MYIFCQTQPRRLKVSHSDEDESESAILTGNGRLVYQVGRDGGVLLLILNISMRFLLFHYILPIFGQQKMHNERMDRRTDGQTDRLSNRDAWTHLKTTSWRR